MQNVEWDLALARLNFVREYVTTMRKEIAMKNEMTRTRSADTTRVPPREPWPAHRRFWHRKPEAPKTPQPKTPQAVKADPRDRRAAATEP